MVKVLNRDSIIRMVGTSGGGSSVYAGGGGGGGGASALYECSDVARDGNKVSGAAEGKALVYGSDGKWYAADSLTNLNVTGQLKMGSKLVATQEWVGQNYLSISFFSSLFKAYAGTDEVTPNNSTANVDNIKAMFGFWTEQYISARGRGAGGGGGGGTGNVTWDELAGTAQNQHKVDISYLTGAISTLTGGTSELSNKRYAVKLNGDNQLFVDVPWTDTIYTLPAEVSYRRYNFTPSTAAGGKWHRLGNYKTMGDATTFVIEVYDGTGYNGQGRQNSVTKITIKDGWQETRAAANSVGTIIERSGYPFATEISIVATSDTEGALWIYLPSQYVYGSYSIYGSYASWTHNSGNSDDTTTRPETNQTLTGDAASYLYYDLTYNSSVSKSGQTLTVKINGTEQSLENTWRGIQNNLTSDSTTDSLSAAQGKALANGSARDNTKLPLSGGEISGNLNVTGTLSMASKLVATQEWVGNNYISISFFETLFNALNSSGNKVDANTTSGIASIKAMFGFWTEQYISARGRGAGGGGGGGTGNVTWDELAGTAATGRKVDISYLTDAISTMTGYTTSGRNYAVEKNASNQLYVNVPWTDHYDWSDITNKPTTLGGYGITDAKIQNGVITLGANTITPLTSHQTVTDGDPTLAWSTRSKVATIGSTDIHVTMPANPDTWRPVQDNLTSTSTTDCLSANQGKTLKGYIDTLNGYFDNSGVANSAAKLTTVSKTAWGQTFWTANGVPDSISGNMTNVGDISFSASGKKIGGFLYFDTTNSRLGVGASSPSYKLHVAGTGYFSDNLTLANNKGLHMIDSNDTANEVMRLTSGDDLIIGGDTASEGYNTYMRGYGVYLQYNGSNTGLMLSSSGNVGIGTTSPSHKLSVSGDIVATGCLTARVTSASDIHAKNISTTVLPLTLVEIANAPTIRFKWKQGDDKEDHVGSIAQYWQSVMPEVIWKNKEGMLTLEYGTAALVSSITIAREVVALKRRIKELEAKLKN